MPSFVRKTPASHAIPPPGTRPSPSASTLHLLSTGLPSMDDLLGGGLPLGTLLLILSPDTQSAWSRLVARHWIAQGLVQGHKSVIVGDEVECRNLIGGCMWVEEREEGKASESEGEGVGEEGQGRGGTRIAWRYERMKKFQTTVGSHGATGGLSLMKTIPRDILLHLETTDQQVYVPVSSIDAEDVLQSTLKRIAQMVELSDRKSAVRITINELGSLDWGDSMTSARIHRFLHSLKGLIREKAISVMITLPSELAKASPEGGDREAWIKSLSWVVDASVELKGFAGRSQVPVEPPSSVYHDADDPTLPPLFPQTHGLLSLHSFPTLHTLLPPTLKHSTLLGVSQSGSQGGAGENNLSFKLKRKKFVLETLHLDVEGGVGERRTEPVKNVENVLEIGKPKESEVEVEGVDGRRVEPVAQAVELPTGPKEEKVRKPRAKVRFGEDEVVEVKQDTGVHEHVQDHAHDHGKDQARRVGVRHDRMDLYEF
ncbi:elongator complex protein 4, partial [Tremellales sp. Uapishka_1]